MNRWTPKFWLAQVERINRMLHPLSMRDHDAHPVRIAVFDTGYSLDSSYLDMYTHEEKRLSGHWVDWVENSRTPVDVDGHGTAMTSLLMKMTQKAEIFTVRVIKRRQDLETSQVVVAKVISHPNLHIFAYFLTTTSGNSSRSNNTERRHHKLITRIPKRR